MHRAVRMHIVVNIYENYVRYTAPRWVRSSINRLMKTLSPEHVGGLRSIVLTSSAAIGRGKTGRVGGRKYLRGHCRGFYHQEWHGEPAWIEIVVDRSIGPIPRFLT